MFENDLVAHLLADSAIAAAVNDQAANERRLYPLERPIGQKNLRAIVYRVISGAPAANIEGDEEGGLEGVRLQLDVWAASHDEARELAVLVQNRMSVNTASIRALRISRASDLDPDTREHREVLDFSVWHSPQQ